MRYVVSLCLLLLLTGCGTKSTLKGEQAPSFADSWETNRAIIKAADASGNFAVAMRTAERELETRPDNDEARVILSRLQTLEGRPKLALETLTPLLNAAGQSEKPATAPSVRSGVLLEQGRAWLVLQDRPQAREYLEECLNAEPGSQVRREARKLLAVSFDEDGRHAEAQTIYEELLSDRDEVPVRYNYGRSLLAAKQYGKSAAVLMPLVDMTELPQARLVAAAALVNNGEPKAARNLLQGYMPDGDIDRILREKRR